ncbi:MAG: TIGR04086 family membrane protein [Clostridiales bacterium]|nr:TIGR04086 family membrane protein [Clostridiales bacterium]
MKKVNYLLQILKGVLISVGVTILGIALIALLVKDADAGSNLVSGLSIAVKIVSIALGTVLSAIKIKRKGAILGALIATPYWIICFLLSLLSATPVFSLGIIIDFVLTVLTGVFSGILTVNTLK